MVCIFCFWSNINYTKTVKTFKNYAALYQRTRGVWWFSSFFHNHQEWPSLPNQIHRKRGKNIKKLCCLMSSRSVPKFLFIPIYENIKKKKKKKTRVNCVVVCKTTEESSGAIIYFCHKSWNVKFSLF